MALPKRGSALMPVPIAVPPIGSRRSRARVSSKRACAEASCEAQAPNSWANVSGIASIRWVRPVLTTSPMSPMRRLMSVVARAVSEAHRRGTYIVASVGNSGPAAPAWVVLDVASPKSSGGATFAKQEDGSLLVSGKRATHDVYTLTAELPDLASDEFELGWPCHAGFVDFYAIKQ